MNPANTLRCRELLILLRKVTQAIDLHSKYLNKTVGLTGPQLVILQELSKGEMTVSQLARRISLSQGTVTDILHRLEKKNAIYKNRSNSDKRQVLISLSEKYRQTLESAPPILQENFIDSFTELEEWEQLMIMSTMNRIVTMMTEKKEENSSIPELGNSEKII